jgi:hypothetical protein
MLLAAVLLTRRRHLLLLLLQLRCSLQAQAVQRSSHSIPDARHIVSSQHLKPIQQLPSLLAAQPVMAGCQHAHHEWHKQLPLLVLPAAAKEVEQARDILVRCRTAGLWQAGIIIAVSTAAQAAAGDHRGWRLHPARHAGAAVAPLDACVLCCCCCLHL